MVVARRGGNVDLRIPNVVPCLAAKSLGGLTACGMKVPGGIGVGGLLVGALHVDQQAAALRQEVLQIVRSLHFGYVRTQDWDVSLRTCLSKVEIYTSGG